MNKSGIPHKGARGGERGDTACAAATYLWGQTNVSVWSFVVSCLQVQDSELGEEGHARGGKGKCGRAASIGAGVE